VVNLDLGTAQRRGASKIFGGGDNGGTKGPERGAEALRGVESGEGRRKSRKLRIFGPQKLDTAPKKYDALVRG